jgi:hypothetical protein
LFECIKCPTTFQTPYDLKVHLTTHNNVKNAETANSQQLFPRGNPISSLDRSGFVSKDNGIKRLEASDTFSPQLKVFQRKKPRLTDPFPSHITTAMRNCLIRQKNSKHNNICISSIPSKIPSSTLKETIFEHNRPQKLLSTMKPSMFDLERSKSSSAASIPRPAGNVANNHVVSKSPVIHGYLLPTCTSKPSISLLTKQNVEHDSQPLSFAEPQVVTNSIKLNVNDKSFENSIKISPVLKNQYSSQCSSILTMPKHPKSASNLSLVGNLKVTIDHNDRDIAVQGVPIHKRGLSCSTLSHEDSQDHSLIGDEIDIKDMFGDGLETQLPSNRTFQGSSQEGITTQNPFLRSFQGSQDSASSATERSVFDLSSISSFYCEVCNRLAIGPKTKHDDSFHSDFVVVKLKQGTSVIVCRS